MTTFLRWGLVVQTFSYWPPVMKVVTSGHIDWFSQDIMLCRQPFICPTIQGNRLLLCLVNVCSLFKIMMVYLWLKKGAIPNTIGYHSTFLSFIAWKVQDGQRMLYLKHSSSYARNVGMMAYEFETRPDLCPTFLKINWEFWIWICSDGPSRQQRKNQEYWQLT